MKTRTKYEEIILNEIRSLPPFILPQAVKTLKSFKEGIESVVMRKQASADNAQTGFCGAWADDRPADEIIADIVEHRSGFGGRKVLL
jgi:hypothetical protein